MKKKLEKFDLVITDTPAFQIFNEEMKRMNHLRLIHSMAIKNLQILVIDNVVNCVLLAKLI
jgi:hypothetical protein